MSKKHAINIILKSGDTGHKQVLKKAAIPAMTGTEKSGVSDHKQELKKEKCYLKLLTRPLRKIVIR